MSKENLIEVTKADLEEMSKNIGSQNIFEDFLEKINWLEIHYGIKKFKCFYEEDKNELFLEYKIKPQKGIPYENINQNISSGHYSLRSIFE